MSCGSGTASGRTSFCFAIRLVADAARAAIAFPGGHNEGFPDTFKQCFRAFYSYIEAATSPRRPPTRPSPTAIARLSSARPSPRAMPDRNGSR